MKTRIYSSIKVSAIAVGLFSIIITSCTSGESKSTEGKETEKKEVSAPAMDIHAAALTGDLVAIEQHIKAGTNLNEKDPFGGSTPLVSASVFGNVEVAKALIEAGADLDLQNNDGSTALHCAAFFGHKDIVEALLVRGADKTITNNASEIPLQSVERPFREMVPVYDFFQKQLGPLGLKLDYEQLEKVRPTIEKMLK